MQPGGDAPLATTGVRWTNMSPITAPLARWAHGMTYDSQSDRVVLFGGMKYPVSDFGDTWAYDYGTNKWTNMNPTTRPPPTRGSGMAYDSESDRVILFGGSSGESLLNDTWAYDYDTNTWTNMTPTPRPPAADGLVLAYDSESDRIISFGGFMARYVTSAQTWAYDYNTNTWTFMNPRTSPIARGDLAMAYDSKSDRVILFGGADTHDTLAINDTWAYDYNTNTWTDMTSTVAPTARDEPTMAYDPGLDRVILFGGLVESPRVNFDDTWSYDYDTNTWTNMSLDVHPPAGGCQGMAYDNRSSRVILFGGGTVNRVMNNETWSFRSSPGAPSPPVTLTYTPGDASVQLAWQPPSDDGGSPITNYSIYRGAASGHESLVFKLGNVLTHTDIGLTNGVTYYYFVTAVNALGEGVRSREISVVPAAPAADMVSPVLTVASPLDGAIVTSTTVTLSGTASDNVAVEKVEVSLDGTTWILATGTTSWSATLTLPEGASTIRVRVTDTSGNVATSTVHVTVEPGLPVWIWPVVAVGVAGAAAAAYVLMRRRRRPAADAVPPPP